MLNGFALAFNGDGGRGRYAFIKGCESGPQHETSKADDQHPKPHADGLIGVGEVIVAFQILDVGDVCVAVKGCHLTFSGPEF